MTNHDNNPLSVATFDCLLACKNDYMKKALSMHGGRTIATILLALLILVSHPRAEPKKNLSQRHVLRHSVEMYNVAFSPDSKVLSTIGADNIVRLWDIQSWRIRSVLRHKNPKLDYQTALAFSTNGFHIAATGHNTLDLWDIDRRQFRSLEGFGSFVQSIAFSPRSAVVAIGAGEFEGRAPSVTLKSTRNGTVKWRRTIRDKGMGAVTAVAFSPDGNVLASGGDDIYLWSVLSGKVISKFNVRGATSSVIFSPDGKTLAAPITQDGVNTQICLFDLKTKKLKKSFTSLRLQVWQLAYSPDGKTLATANQLMDRNGESYTGDVRLWDVKTGQMVRILAGHTAPVRSVTFSADGKWLASASEDKTVIVWNLSN